MHFKMFDEHPEVADQIPAPHKEDVTPDREAEKEKKTFPNDVVINCNVNTKPEDDENKPPVEVNPENSSSDTVNIENNTGEHWSEPHSDRTEDSAAAMEDFHISIDEPVNHENYLAFSGDVKHILSSVAYAERLVRNDRRGIVGTEGIGGMMVNGLAGIVNIFGHIAYLAKTALFDGWRDFKRSELKAWSDSNIVTLHRLYNADYVRCSKCRTYLPQDMKSRYFITQKALFECLNTMDMLGRSQKMLKAAEKILQSSRAVNSTFTGAVKDVYREFANMNQVNFAFQATEKCFQKGAKDEVTFDQAFDNMGEFKTVVSGAIDEGNSHLQAVASVFSRMKEVEEIVTELSTNVQNAKVSRSDLDTLAKIARTWAELFDKYAVVVNDVYRIDHNLTLNVVDLRKHLQM